MMDTIIVGYDSSQPAERALERAVELARALAARLLVVSVARSSRSTEAAPVLEPGDAPIPVLLPGPVATGAPMPPMPMQEAPRPEPEVLAQHQLERARTSLLGKRVEAEYLAEFGDPAERLLTLARERAADLIVVGSHEHGFLDRLLGRHVDEAVAARAGCDVLLVH
jgi:nucleotide-binding universal stress UspA family protein